MYIDNANGSQVVERAESFRTRQLKVVFVVQVSRYGRGPFQDGVVYLAIIYLAVLYLP